ncbi:MAG: AAA family ATPase [Planctomycetota bacterium]
MLIRRVRVENFGVLSGPLSVELGPGINLVHGRNESGKSTLMRAIWNALTLHASVRGDRRDCFVPHDGGIPEVEVVFEHEGRSYQVAKCFKGKRGTTRLIRRNEDGSVEDSSGDEAETLLRAALGLSPRQNHRSGERELGIWPLIWVRQERARTDPSDDLNTGSLSSLSGRLEELTSEVLGGAGAEGLFLRVREEYERYFTSTGREKKSADAPLGDARLALAEASREFQELEARNNEHLEDVERLASTAKDLADLEAELPELARTLEEARRAERRTEDLRVKVSLAEKERQLAERAAHELRHWLARRGDLRRELARASAERDHWLERAEVAAGRLARHDAELAKLDREKAETARAKEESEREWSHVRRQRDCVLAVQVLNSLRQRSAQAAALEELIEEHAERLDLQRVDEETLEEVERLERAARADRRAVENAATAVHVRALRDVKLRIDGGELALGAGETLMVKDASLLGIEDLIELEVRPKHVDVQALQAAMEESEAALSRKLQELGAKDPAEARRLAVERQRLVELLDAEEDKLEFLAPDGVATLEEELEAATQTLALAREELAQHREPESTEDPQELELRLTAAELANDEARGRYEQTTSSVEELLSWSASLVEAKTSAETRAREWGRRIDKLLASIAQEEQAHGSDEDLEEERARRETELERRELEHARLARELEASSCRKGTEEALAVLEAARARLVELRSEHDRLRGRLQAGQLFGLHEKLEKAEQRRRLARLELERWEERAAAASLLYETLDQCRADAHQSCLDPLRKTLEPLLAELFPECRVEFDERLRLKELGRTPPSGSDSDVDISRFEALSSGTREQLAVLVRLGMALVLAGDGTLPVILDDSFVGSDDTRFAALARVLNRVSRQLQIILFSWNRDRCRDFGLRLEKSLDLEALKQGASPQPIKPNAQSLSAKSVNTDL